jgi:ABC-type branched-subunit amino acid transport system ATPase component
MHRRLCCVCLCGVLSANHLDSQWHALRQAGQTNSWLHTASLIAAGNTTLLDTLAGRVPRNVQDSGEVHVNGHVTKMSYGTVSYVPQQDHVTGTLTVRETLQYTARLRCFLC